MEEKKMGKTKEIEGERKQGRKEGREGRNEGRKKIKRKK